MAPTGRPRHERPSKGAERQRRYRRGHEFLKKYYRQEHVLEEGLRPEQLDKGLLHAVWVQLIYRSLGRFLKFDVTKWFDGRKRH
jgi:hypothetical protein